MSDQAFTWSVFTKPWPSMSLPALAKLVSGWGFDGVEFPLRPGFQIDLDRLPGSAADAARIFADHGLQITSVASTPTEQVFATCAELGIPVIRIMATIYPEGYPASGDLLRAYLDSLVPLCDRFGVQVGIQPHADDYIADSSELATLLTHYDPRHMVAVWDSAHDALARKAPSHGIGLLRSHLAIANFKNVCYTPGGRRDDGSQEWKTTWVPGPDGLGRWSDAVAALLEWNYSGTICMAAEYSDESTILTDVPADLAYLRSLLATATA